MNEENATRLIAAVALYVGGLAVMAARPEASPEEAVDLAARAWERANETARKANIT